MLEGKLISELLYGLEITFYLLFVSFSNSGAPCLYITQCMRVAHIHINIVFLLSSTCRLQRKIKA
jgi:uncharacterized membrane protein